MGLKYCPNCGRVVKTRALLGGYRQFEFNGILVKARRIKHREEENGCGYEWETVELPVDRVPGFQKKIPKK